MFIAGFSDLASCHCDKITRCINLKEINILNEILLSFSCERNL